MKKHLLTSIIILCFCLFSIAQKQGKPYEIKLNKARINGVLTSFEVLDLRDNTNELGITYTGVNKTKRIARLENGATFQIKNLLENSISFKKEIEDSLIFVIKEMSTLEDFLVKKASLNVFFEFYVKRDSLYYKADDFDGFSFYRSYKMHGNYITQALQAAILQFQQTYFNKQFEYVNGINREELEEKKVKYNFDILKTQQYNPGFYRTYEEFINNSPSINNVQILTQEEQLEFKNIIAYDILQVKNPDNISPKKYREKLKKMWGFSDGENIFINNKSLHNADFFSKIETKGPYCYFLSLETEKSTSFLEFALTLAAGVVGAAIGNKIKGISIGISYSTSINNKYGQAYVLKLENQKIVTVNVSSMAFMLRSDQETVSAYKDERRRGKRAVKLKYLQLFNERNTEDFLKKMEKE